MKFKYSLLAFFLAFSFVSEGYLYAQNKKQDKTSTIDSLWDKKQLEEVVVYSRQMLGSKFKARNRTGSAYYLSPIEIQKMDYSDINRMLKSVPGVNMYEEDGFGLRPNISLRGTKAERSERINIMEDGVLAAPAPYSAPAAYYFPNAARMSAVEVLKGSSQVQYGPFTTGGAINMVSTPIPKRFSGKANVSYGVYNTFKSHVNIGNDSRHWGYLVEYLRYQSDGFRDNPYNEDTGFERNDLITKLRWHSSPSASVKQAVELKFGFANEDSDETYVGLSEDDFSKRTYFRYAGAREDNMTTEHYQTVLSHFITPIPKLKITSQVYYNYFHRNWYKLSHVRAGNGKYEKKGITEILSDPETNSRYLAILKGEKDFDGEALFLRANNRDYYGRGIQTKVEYRWNKGLLYLNFEGGLRYHEDGEDRYQWDDSYSMIGTKMKLYRAGRKGQQSSINANRLTTAEALASYVLTKLSYKKLTLTAGLRYEDVLLEKRDYGKQDYKRTGYNRIDRSNHVRSLIPSLGLNFKLLRSLSLFGGVHKGFAPPSAGYQQKAESSINTELGLRLSTRKLKAELIGYYNAYSNMLGSDLAASGGLGTLEQFDVGEAIVNGLEFLVNYQPLPEEWAFKLPLQFSYTYTNTEMKNKFLSSSWGQVLIGDEIPYIYKHSLSGQVGLEHKNFDLNVGMRYNGDMRTVPGQGAMAERHKIPAHFLLDASLGVRLYKGLKFKLKGINLLNNRYLTSRHPAGLRAGHPRGVYVGFNYQF